MKHVSGPFPDVAAEVEQPVLASAEAAEGMGLRIFRAAIGLAHGFARPSIHRITDRCCFLPPSRGLRPSSVSQSLSAGCSPAGANDWVRAVGPLRRSPALGAVLLVMPGRWCRRGDRACTGPFTGVRYRHALCLVVPGSFQYDPGRSGLLFQAARMGDLHCDCDPHPWEYPLAREPIEAAADRGVPDRNWFGGFCLLVWSCSRRGPHGRRAGRNRGLSILRGSLPFDLRQTERLCMP
ncbi:hypothetical protein V1289_008299 [Bradyrhizobium sp. AZCC 2289]